MVDRTGIDVAITNQKGPKTSNNNTLAEQYYRSQ